MPVEIRWVAHSTFEIRCGGLTIVIDPFYGNPMVRTPMPERVDWVLVTHDHGDHIANAPDLAKRGAKVVVQPETGHRLEQEKGVPPDSIVEMGIGGTIRLGEDMEATMIQAFHSSESAEPAGYVVRAGGFTFAHLGDTALFGDLGLIGEMFPVDLAMVPIGGHYTMDGRQAAKAVSLLGARIATPMHYRTFPVLAQSADAFLDALKKAAPGVETWVPEPGESRTF